MLRLLKQKFYSMEGISALVNEQKLKKIPLPLTILVFIHLFMYTRYEMFSILLSYDSERQMILLDRSVSGAGRHH